jgi:hypothetical protein
VLSRVLDTTRHPDCSQNSDLRYGSNGDIAIICFRYPIIIPGHGQPGPVGLTQPGPKIQGQAGPKLHVGPGLGRDFEPGSWAGLRAE